MKLLLTGANGFLGKSILNAANTTGLNIRPVFRKQELAIGIPDAVILPALDASTDWSQALQGVDVVIHAAARSHVMRDEMCDSLEEYRRVNVQGTLKLARQAASAKVKRFVFISSIKVNGEETEFGQAFTAYDLPNPRDPYGISKAEAERELRLLADVTGMEVTIIRPPLIYGRGVKGNFAKMIYWVSIGVPLPLGGLTKNRRSLVGLDNIVNLILICTKHPKAANQTFLVSDGEDLSTAVLLSKIGKAMNRPARLVWIPSSVIKFIAYLLGIRVFSRRLVGSLQVDINKTRELLKWEPLISVDEGLRRAME